MMTQYIQITVQMMKTLGLKPEDHTLRLHPLIYRELVRELGQYNATQNMQLLNHNGLDILEYWNGDGSPRIMIVPKEIEVHLPVTR